MLQLSAIWYKELGSVCQHGVSLKTSLLRTNRKRETNSDFFHMRRISSASNFALPIRGTVQSAKPSSKALKEQGQSQS